MRKLFEFSSLLICFFLIAGLLATVGNYEKVTAEDKPDKPKKEEGKDSPKTEKPKTKEKPKAEEKVEEKGKATEEKGKGSKDDKDKENKEDKEEPKVVNLPWAEAYQEIKNRLETVKINIELKDKTIFEAVEYFQDVLFIHFRITPKVSSDYGTKTVSVALKNLEAKMALRLVISMYDLKCLYDDGSLVVMAPDETVVGEYVTVIYRIDDLLAPPPEDFKAPQVESTLQNSSGIKWPDSPDIEPREKKVITKEEIENAIKTQTGEKLWEDTKNVSLTVTNRFLVVTHTKAVHKKIIEILNSLRATQR